MQMLLSAGFVVKQEDATTGARAVPGGFCQTQLDVSPDILIASTVPALLSSQFTML